MPKPSTIIATMLLATSTAISAPDLLHTASAPKPARGPSPPSPAPTVTAPSAGAPDQARMVGHVETIGDFGEAPASNQAILVVGHPVEHPLAQPNATASSPGTHAEAFKVHQPPIAQRQRLVALALGMSHNGALGLLPPSGGPGSGVGAADGNPSVGTTDPSAGVIDTSNSDNPSSSDQPSLDSGTDHSAGSDLGLPDIPATNDLPGSDIGSDIGDIGDIGEVIRNTPTPSPSAIPAPPALGLFGMGIAALASLRRYRR